MEVLKEYISNVETLLLKQITGKPKEFIELFLQKKYISEDAFIDDFCGDKYSKRYYADCKAKTIRILQIMSIISDIKGGSKVKKNYDFCQKKFLLGQKLMMQGQKKEGIRVIKQAYKVAIKYDFVHLACELSSILRYDHVHHHPNKRLTKHYAKQTEKYLREYVAEKKAENHFYNAVESIYSSDPTIKFREAIEDIKQYKGQSVKYGFYLFSITVFYQLEKGDHQELENTCFDALSFFESKKGAYPTHYFSFLSYRATAQIAIGKYKEAEQSLQEAEQYTKNSPYNHYILQFYKTLNALHAGEYQEAYRLYSKNKRCKVKRIKQQFIIIEAYLFFLVYTGHLQIDKGFRIGKYLNETINAQQDKKGDNINILIAELLVYLAKDQGKFIDRVETVKDYSYRYLTGEDTKRAKWFLKILCLIAHSKVNFHPIALKRKAKRYIDLLDKHHVIMGHNFTVEIIPFHHLLEMILERAMRKVA